jgi:hypothetical protein
MKIVKLDINPEWDLAGVDAVALVENPAIEEDFMYFSGLNEEEFAETYTDYPQGAVDAAKMGIKRNEALGNKCGTQVGKVRAQQLAQGKPISLDTIRRMRAFLIRQKGNYELALERKNYNACGYISYLLWGGPEALPWAEKKLRQAEGEEFKSIEEEIIEGIIGLEMGKIKDIYSHVNGEAIDNTTDSPMINDKFAALDEQQIVIGPLMKPNMLIPRMDEFGEKYYVYFTEETIKKIAYKLMKDKMIDRVNLEHNGADVVDAYLVESWIVNNPNQDKALSYGYTPKQGEWFGMYKIEDKKVWDEYVKTGKVKGFSVEGMFQNILDSYTKTI